MDGKSASLKSNLDNLYTVKKIITTSHNEDVKGPVYTMKTHYSLVL